MTKIILNNPKLEQDIPVERIHPDPVQPRTHADTDLAASIKSQGVLQAISIEPAQDLETFCEHCAQSFAKIAAAGDFMISDGERRWTAARAAGARTILAKIIPASTEGPRLKRQLTSNTAKPLSPVEEAFAFQRLMEVESWSQAELARQLGRPRSVIGDRIRLVGLDAVWLDLIRRDMLQVSHAAQLHLYAAVPAKYQAEAAEKIVEEWIGEHEITGDAITVEDFDFALRDAFRPYLAPIGDVSPQYHGPTVEVTLDYNGKRKYAADPEIWKPIAADKAKRAKQDSKSTSAQRSSSPKKKSVLDQFPDLPERKASGSYDFQLAKGEIKVWTEQMGWDNSFLGLPAVFLAKVDRSKLTRISLKYSGGVLVTTDAAAVGEAQTAFAAELKTHIEQHVVELVASLAEQLPRFRIAGPGARTILDDAGARYGHPLSMLTRALNVKLEGLAEDKRISRRGSLRISDADADLLATAYLATLDGAVKVTVAREISVKLWRKYSNAPVKFPASKKQEKREARAAGKQVGDPARAHDDNLHGILDEESILESEGVLEEEEELVEA